MRKADIEYIEDKLAYINERSKLNFVLHDKAIGIKLQHGGLRVYKEGTTNELRTYAQGMADALDRIPKDLEDDNAYAPSGNRKDVGCRETMRADGSKLFGCS